MTNTDSTPTTLEASTVKVLAAKILARMLKPQDTPLSAHRLAADIFDKITMGPLRIDPCSITDGRGVNSREGRIGGVPACRITEDVSLSWVEYFGARCVAVERNSLSIDISKELVAAIADAYSEFHQVDGYGGNADPSHVASTAVKWLTAIIQASSFELMRVNISNDGPGWNIMDPVDHLHDLVELSKPDVSSIFAISGTSNLEQSELAYRTHCFFFSHEENRGHMLTAWKHGFIKASILIICGVACLEVRGANSAQGISSSGHLTHVGHASVDDVAAMIGSCDRFLMSSNSPFKTNEVGCYHFASKKIIEKAMELVSGKEPGRDVASRISFFYPSAGEDWHRG